MIRRSSVVCGALIACLLGTVWVDAFAEDMQSAHERTVEALSSGDVQALEELLADDGFLIFSLGEYRAEVSLSEWLPQFEGMVAHGVTLTVHERDLRSGSGEQVGWVFSVQEMSWMREGETEPSSTAAWNTTEAWELRDGAWKLVHIHHSSAPEPEDNGGAEDD